MNLKFSKFRKSLQKFRQNNFVQFQLYNKGSWFDDFFGKNKRSNFFVEYDFDFMPVEANF